MRRSQLCFRINWKVAELGFLPSTGYWVRGYFRPVTWLLINDVIATLYFRLTLAGTLIPSLGTLSLCECVKINLYEKLMQLKMTNGIILSVHSKLFNQLVLLWSKFGLRANLQIFFSKSSHFKVRHPSSWPVFQINLWLFFNGELIIKSFHHISQ